MTTLQIIALFNRTLVANGFPRGCAIATVQVVAACTIYEYTGWPGVFATLAAFIVGSYLIALGTLLLFARRRLKQHEADTRTLMDDPDIQALKRKVRDGVA